MEMLIRAGGIYCIVLVVFHLLFWRIFHWPEELRRLSALNRAIMQVLNLSLTFVFAVFAYVSLVHTAALLSSDLGRVLLALIASLWLFRALLQAVFFGLRQPLSWVFLVFFLGGMALYAAPFVAD